MNKFVDAFGLKMIWLLPVMSHDTCGYLYGVHCNMNTIDRIYVELSGMAGLASSVNRPVSVLIAQFLDYADITGSFRFNLTAHNRSEYFRKTGIKLKPEANLQACSMIVRIDSDHQYVGYLISKNGLTSADLFRKLLEVTQKRYFYPDEVKDVRVLETKTEVSADLSQESVHTVVSTPVDHVEPVIEEKPVQPMEHTSVPSVQEVIAMSTVPTKRSMLGFSKDPESLKLVVMAFLEIYPDGIAPAKGLATKLISKLDPKGTPKSMGPILKAACKAGVMATRVDLGKTMYVVPVVNEEKQESPTDISVQHSTVQDSPIHGTPTVPLPVHEVSAVVPSTQPSIAQPVSDMSLMGQMSKMLDMAKELGGALQGNEELGLRIVEVEGQISSLQVQLDGMKAQRAEYAAILNSELHKQARELIAKIRDAKL